MKQITNKTILLQGDKTYQPIEVDGVVCWVYKRQIVAQTTLLYTNKPIISLDSYVEKLTYDYNLDAHENIYGQVNAFKAGYKANPNQYTQKDIEKAIELGFSCNDGFGEIREIEKIKILEQLNSISVIEVDKQFNIISYE
jgi:hypothetical protein